jgi:hypothetical protein
MDQQSFEREEALNRRACEEMRDQVRRDHNDKCTAIAFGKLIAATPTVPNRVGTNFFHRFAGCRVL